MPKNYHYFALTPMFVIVELKKHFGAQRADYLCVSVTNPTYPDPVIHYLLQSETHFYLKISVPTCEGLCSY
jgi:hypothetical protein